MKAIKKLNIILISYLLIVSFFGIATITSDEAEAQSEYSLYEAAITYDYISVVIQGDYSGYDTSFNLVNGDGVFFGRCIEMQVTSSVSYSLEITVHLGRQLICRETDIQNMVVTKEYTFTIGAYETKTPFRVYAMCMDMPESAPCEGVYYDLGPVCSGDVYDTVRQISTSDSQGASGQCALWAVTDSTDGDHLRQYGASDDDINEAQGILDAAGVSYNIEEGAGFPLIWIIVIIIIVVVVLIIILILASKRKKGMAPVPPAPPVQPVAPAQPEPPAQTTPKFCTNCGATIKPGVKFCTECGHKL